GHAPTQIQTALGLVLDRAPKTYLAGVFGSYGWSGEAVDLLETKLRDAGFRFGFEPIRVKFKPTEADLQTCEQAGTDFAQVLKKVRRQRQSRSSVEGAQSARLEQAVGRIVGPVCVVIARQGELSGAMVATWVSQASFNPPGITVAVAKERAVESLMHQGHHFVLNVLPEGKPLPKHFLKPFAPGEDRLAGLNLVETPAGGTALPDALAVLDCVVQQRLDCGDHWVIYAAVTAGNLRNPNGVTAIHQRRSGSFY
ncbi:MAG: diflavin flavoprotein, partial [Gloeomargaritaceae cyanobacterium C42_A2020_066]|nr:diflavin flavoprotein [Gloeomargaritaceae cyanobacterium C42_A2020_066]